MPRLRFLVCAVLISCLCSYGLAAAFLVSQTPSTVCLKDGSVQIFCCLNISTNGLKVKWIKDDREVKSNPLRGPVTQNPSCFTLFIRNTQKSDSGFYICEITQDIPKLKKINGSGTNVTCKENNSTNLPSEETPTPGPAELSAPLLGASVSAAMLIITTCVCLIVWKMNKCHPHTDRVVIREGPPSEQEEPENSGEDSQSSRNSRGSTLWYMVPVYESYFDLQRSDEPKECAKSLNTG